jgi:hypothetical protein
MSQRIFEKNSSAALVHCIEKHGMPLVEKIKNISLSCPQFDGKDAKTNTVSVIFD